MAWSQQPLSTSEGLLVRDSKNGDGPMLTVPAAAWHRLVRDVPQPS
ncbi:MAG: DUF397 domain-containing protein [Actinophytocola sp.]